MARPTKLTPEVQERICMALKAGATYRLAAQYGGISYQTLNEWRKEFPEFSDALASSEGVCAMRCLATIQKAALEQGEWRAAFALLERRWPHEYGRNVQEVEVDQKRPFLFVIAKKLPDGRVETPEETHARARAEAAALMGDAGAMVTEDADEPDEPPDTTDEPGAYQDTSEASERQNDRTAALVREERQRSLAEQLRQAETEMERLKEVQRTQQRPPAPPPSIYTQEERRGGPGYERRPDRRMPGMPSAGSLFSRRGGGLL